jgi:Sigma-70 region 2
VIAIANTPSLKASRRPGISAAVRRCIERRSKSRNSPLSGCQETTAINDDAGQAGSRCCFTAARRPGFGNRPTLAEQYLSTPSTSRPQGAAVDNRTDEDLLVAIAAGPGALPEFYRRHVAKIVGVGSRRFDEPEDVADFVATVFLEVMESAGGFDPRRGRAVAWLYGLAANLAARQLRQRTRAADAARRLSGRQFLEPDDYERIDEQLDGQPGRARLCGDGRPRARRPPSARVGRRRWLVPRRGRGRSWHLAGGHPSALEPRPPTAARCAGTPSISRTGRPRIPLRRSRHDHPRRPA